MRWLQALAGAVVLMVVVQAAAAQEIKDTLPQTPEGRTWKLVWHDEFDGTGLDGTKWIYPPDGKRKGGYWLKNTVSLDGRGHLVIATQKDGDRYAGGCILSKGKFEHTFGYYVARVQLQKQPGHWTAFWLQGSGMKTGNTGQQGTEIDIYEKPWLDERVQHTLHWGGYGAGHKSEGKVVKVPGVMEGWHTFSLWWTPTEYVFYVDGKETWRTNAGGVCQAPLYIMVSDEVGNWGGDITKAKLPDSLLVDYVRVYDLVNRK